MPNQGTPFGHNIDNYTIGKGVVSLKLLGEGSFVDCGNAPTFEFLPKITQLDHFSSRSGVKTKDATFVIQKEGTLTIILDELSARNMAMALMGTLTDTGSPGGAVSIDIMSLSTITAAVQFVGENDIGVRWTWNFPKVNFTPSKAIGLISDVVATLELVGDVLADDTGHFGTATATVNDAAVA